MKAICEGTQTRNDVVQQNLEQYRAVFARTTQQMDVLRTVSVDPLPDIRAFVLLKCWADAMTGDPEVRPRT